MSLSKLNDRTLAIVQARMGSTRLPGKVLKEVCGKSFLEHLILRLKQANSLDQIVVATTTLSRDDPIVQLCQRLGVEVYRGSEEDVLGRFYGVIQHKTADIIVRLTADNPLIDPSIVDFLVTEFKAYKPDYLSNTLYRSYPKGMDVEVFSKEALEKAFHHAIDPYDREHVTPYFYRHPELFSLQNVQGPYALPDLRLTLDTEEDLQMINKIFTHLFPENPDFRLDEIIHFLGKDAV